MYLDIHLNVVGSYLQQGTLPNPSASVPQFTFFVPQCPAPPRWRMCQANTWHKVYIRHTYLKHIRA